MYVLCFFSITFIEAMRVGKKEKIKEFEKNILGRYSLITIVGSSELLVEGMRGILDYSAESLRVNTISGILLIMGTELEIASLTSEEISVKGKINSIEFCL